MKCLLCKHLRANPRTHHLTCGAPRPFFSNAYAIDAHAAIEEVDCPCAELREYPVGTSCTRQAIATLYVRATLALFRDPHCGLYAAIMEVNDTLDAIERAYPVEESTT